jgi:hypothetical protein
MNDKPVYNKYYILVQMIDGEILFTKMRPYVDKYCYGKVERHDWKYGEWIRIFTWTARSFDWDRLHPTNLMGKIIVIR